MTIERHFFDFTGAGYCFFFQIEVLYSVLVSTSKKFCFMCFLPITHVSQFFVVISFVSLFLIFTLISSNRIENTVLIGGHAKKTTINSVLERVFLNVGH